MVQRTLHTIFDEGSNHVQVLTQSMPRSFKMHVWAARVSVMSTGTEEMKYLGVIQPLDQTDLMEVEQLVRELFLKEYDKIVD